MFHGKLTEEIALGLKELRGRIAKAQVPASKLDETLNLATWNIREFGKKQRTRAALHLIAEIIGQFDLVAITEVRDDLTDLVQVLSILGPYWKVVYSDYVIDPGGNRERVAYVYDKRAVVFTGLAAEASPPRVKDPKTGEYVSQLGWWRSPYIASFQAGNFDFVLITAHVRWGASEAQRIPELRLLAEWVDKRREERNETDKDIILLGDFNIPSVKDDLFAAITSKGLRLAEALVDLPGSNLTGDKRYDQILHYPQFTKSFTGSAGVLDFHSGGFASLFPGMKLSDHEYTFQLSDHMPLWVQLDTDIDGERLDNLLAERKKKASDPDA
jgi:endonuclease/exonuclease/phosphatase family metal-dependent hydrolase